MQSRLIAPPRHWPLALAALIVAVGILAVFGPWEMASNPVIGASTSLYQEVESMTATWPTSVGALTGLLTEALLVALVALLGLALWWDRANPRSLAVGLGGIAGTGIAALATLVVKSMVAEQRPCTAVPGVHPLSACPPLGDWSFPSNHSVIAAGLATAVVLASLAARRVWLWVLASVTALVVGALRVISGVHYPHDVVAGLVFGASVTLAVAVALTPMLTVLVHRSVPAPRASSAIPHKG